MKFINMKTKIVFLLLLTSTWVTKIYAQCDSYEIKSIASNLSVNIVDKAWDGGNNITSIVNNCSFNESTGVLAIDVIIEFYGQFSGNYYRSDGVLRFNGYTYEYTFDPYYKNQNLIDYENLIGFILTSRKIYEIYKD